MTGLLLFAHGARDAQWARPFEAVALRLRELRPDCTVALAFLEFMGPDLRTAVDAMVHEGVQEIRIVPLFLGAGGHVRRDVPALLEQLAQAHPHVSFELASAVGEDPRLIESMASIAAAPAVLR